MNLQSVKDFQNLPSAQAFSAPSYRSPLRGEVKALLLLLGWGHHEVHRHLGVSYHEGKKMSSTVSNWVGGDQSQSSCIPYVAWATLLLFAGILTIEDLRVPVS